MQNYNDVVLDQNGNIVPTASITITDMSNNPVVVYGNNIGSIKAQPFTPNQLGEYFFYAPDGRYNINVSFHGQSYTISDVQLFDSVALNLKADKNNPTFTGTVAGITSAMVGLGNVNNTSDANKPVSIAQQTALDLKQDKAPLAASSGSSLVGFQPLGTGAPPTTVQVKERQISSLSDFGCVLNGSTDDFVSATKAITALNAGEINSLFINGMCAINGTLTVTRNGTNIYGQGSNQETTGFKQLGNVNTLVFQNTTPSTTKIYDCSIRDFSLVTNSLTPTAGISLIVNGMGQFQASNLIISNCYSGLAIKGGYTQNWSNITILGASGWTTRQIGTFLAQIAIGDDNGVPSEINFSNINWKGNTNVTNTMDQGILISCGDGIFFSNGHVGFTYSSDCNVTCSAAPAFVDEINFTNIYFDGNMNGAGVGTQIYGSGPQVTNVKFNTCTFDNHMSHAASISATNCGEISFTDCKIRSNAGYGMIFGAQRNVSVIGSTFYNNNTGNTSANAINATGTTGYRFQNNLIYGSNASGTGFAHPVGIAVDATSSDGSVTENQFKNCTIPMSVVSPRTTFGRNRLIGANPSVVAATTLPSTYLGFDSCEVTGNTAVTAIAGTSIAGYELNLTFTGTPTMTRGNNLLLTTGGGNMVCTPGSVLKLINDGTNYREVSRAVA